ncbi:MAG: hypothetical protein MJA27_34040 [Pseudanabaenales cyanobacterium]|nr:hypothetical protein [Pseudanabaenales cyanobacterium]
MVRNTTPLAPSSTLLLKRTVGEGFCDGAAFNLSLGRRTAGSLIFAMSLE